MPELETQPAESEVKDSKKSGVYDGLIGLLLLVFINIIWFRENPGFLGVQPHPYWIVILPVAARHGFSAALITSGLAVCLYVMMPVALNISLLSLLEYILDPDIQKNAVLFITAGIVIGEISQMQKRKFRKLEVEYNDLKNSFDTLSESYEDLSMAKQELDSHIISQEQTVSTFYEAAQPLRSLEENEIYPAVLELLKKYIYIKAGSIYMKTEDKLILIDSAGNTDIERPKEILPDEGMTGQAFMSGKTVTIRQLKETDKPDIILSAPLHDSENKVLGVLNIEKIPFTKFNPHTIRMASIIADWLGCAIENARTFRETKDQNISDDITGAYTFQYSEKRLYEEFIRSKRYNFPCSLIVLQIVAFHLFPEGIKQDILKVLSTIIHNRKREMDLLFHGKDSSRYLILLPNTPVEGARIFRERVIREVDSFQFRPYQDEDTLLQINAGEAETAPDMTSHKELIRKAFDGMPFQKRIREEFSRFLKDRQPFSILAFEVCDYEEMSQKTKEDITVFLLNIFQYKTETIQNIYHQINPAKFVVFLPKADIQTGNQVRDEILKEIRAFMIKPFEDEKRVLRIRAGAAQSDEKITDASDLVHKAFESMI